MIFSVLADLITRSKDICLSGLTVERFLCPQSAELHEVRHHSAQEVQSRQELDSYHLQSLEQLREGVGDRDRQLQDLRTQLDRSSRDKQLLRQRNAKDIRQVTLVLIPAIQTHQHIIYNYKMICFSITKTDIIQREGP